MNDKQKHKLEHVTASVTKWVGTTQSIILHSLFFVGIFVLVPVLGLDKVMLVLTTAVSLEAIYLSLFIQMTVNRNTESLEDVEEDIDEIQEDVENVEGDIDKIQDHVEDLGEGFEDLSDDFEKIQDHTKTIVTPAHHQTSSTALLLQMQKQLDIISHELISVKEEVKTLRAR